MADAKPPRGKLVLRTYDPVSGATLKYGTSKAAEVTRLVQMLGSLGRRMAALPALPAADVAMLDVPAEGSGGRSPTPVGNGGGGSTGGGQQQQQQQQQGGGGKNKKKKGKR